MEIFLPWAFYMFTLQKKIKSKENYLCIPKPSLQPDVHCSIFYSCQCLAKTWVPVKISSVYIGIVFSRKMKEILSFMAWIILEHMDHPGAHGIKWNTLDTGRQIPCDLTSMWNLKCSARSVQLKELESDTVLTGCEWGIETWSKTANF